MLRKLTIRIWSVFRLTIKYKKHYEHQTFKPKILFAHTWQVINWLELAYSSEGPTHSVVPPPTYDLLESTQ